MFEELPLEVLATCKFTKKIATPRLDVQDIKVAMDYRDDYIEEVKLPKCIYTGRYFLETAHLTDKSKWDNLVELVKEIEKFQSILMSAMRPFKSGEKLIAKLPWAEQYYPEYDKHPTCSIVSFGEIEAANRLMGVKN